MDVPTLKLSPRSVTGKKVKTLRRAGIVPVHIYGRDAPPLSLQVDALVLRRLLPRVGANIPLSVEVEDQKGEDICFVREVQRHPVTEDVLHVDFLRVDVLQTITLAGMFWMVMSCQNRKNGRITVPNAEIGEQSETHENEAATRNLTCESQAIQISPHQG